MSRRPPAHRTPATNVHPLLEQAVGLHQAGRIAEAAGIYEKIIAQAPDHFDATHLLGVIALQEGRLEQAQNLIAAALRINPNDTAALNNLGTVHLRNHELEVAHKHFERAVKLKPDDGDAWSGLAFTASENKQYQVALNALFMRSKYLSETPATYFLWATSYDSLHLSKQAQDYYHKFLTAADGKFPDQEWQARHRLVALGGSN